MKSSGAVTYATFRKSHKESGGEFVEKYKADRTASVSRRYKE